MKPRLIIAVASLAAAPVYGAAPRLITVPQDYPTITAAITAANSGDTIQVNPGTYTRGAQDWGFHNKLITLRSVGGPAVTQLNMSGGFGLAISGPAELSGFTITGGGGNFGEAIRVSGAGTLIRGNIFENNRGPVGGAGAAIVGNPASPIIEGNIFRNNTTDLFQEAGGVIAFYNGSTSGRSSPVIQNNVFVDNQAAAIQLVMPSGNQPIVINNTFVNNSVAVSYRSFSTAVIRNNIFANNMEGFRFTDGVAQGGVPFWDHNLYFNSGPTYDSWMSMNILSDPQFRSAIDFHLEADSPAIGVGLVTGAPDFDFDGVARSAASNDLGAYAFVPEPATLVVAVAGLFCLRSAARAGGTLGLPRGRRG